MSLWNVAVQVLSVVNSLLTERKEDVAEKTGLSVEAVGKVSGVVGDILTKDERIREAVMAEIDKARAHDAAMGVANALPIIGLLRGLVRPVITLTAFFWYVYARCAGVPMGAEDYAIVGGIMAFWFGLRPFEKIGGDTEGVAAKTPLRGK
ncbi:MAG: hypothetical protein DI628_03010 [Blastochloris viridis]|uniref:Holin of 3TMs, for gene-transfer release n=1 Tax=Blastochloris viridis TaxID=1079 RepID=A0A6N4R510_BLAVI|nr:MAG: hypothetical protein DI628_03010 [Blastochloris viridis]